MPVDTNDETKSSQELNSDKPIESAEYDRLGYAPFASAIAASIAKRTPTDGIVYAIHGPWGSGKTSVVNMVTEALKAIEKTKASKSKTTVVKFNPWWFSDQSDLAKSFFTEIAAELNQGSTKKIAEGLRKIGRQLSGSKEILGALLSLVPGGGAASPFLKGSLEALEPYLSENESLDRVRRELIAALTKYNERILVIIDDVDRLPADEIKQIFRLVKSVADLPNIVYLLVFDRDIARKAVGDLGAPDSPEWLEKIVQASFDLPPVHAVDLRKILIEGINKIIGDKTAGNETRIANILFACVFPWILTPRDVSRLLNAVNVSLPAVIDDVDMTEFIAIEAMRIFEPKLYSFIRTQQDKLTGISDPTRGDDRPLGDEILTYVSDKKKEQTKESLRRLFPRLESIWNNRNYGEGFVVEWDQKRRVCISRHFPSYFSYAIGDDILKSTEIDSLISSLEDLDTFSAQIGQLSQRKRRNETTKAALVLDTISSKGSEIAPDKLLPSINTLLKAAHLLYPYHDGGSHFIDIPFTWSYWYAAQPLLERLDNKERATAIIDAIDQSESLVGLNFVVTALEGEYGMHKGAEKKPAENRLVTEAELGKIQESLISRIENMANCEKLISQPDLRYLLLKWSEARGDDAVRSWSNNLLNDDENTLKLAASLMSKGSSHGSEDYVITTYYRIDRDMASKYVDLDLLTQRLEAIDVKGGGGAEIARQFLRALDSKGKWGSTEAE